MVPKGLLRLLVIIVVAIYLPITQVKPDSKVCFVSHLPNAGDTLVSFKNDVLKILETSCAVEYCHNGSQSPSLKKHIYVRLNAYKIKTRINNEQFPMPPANSGTVLTKKEKEIITSWIDQGAMDN